MYKLVIDTNVLDYFVESDITKDFFNDLNIDVLIPTYVEQEILDSKKNLLIQKLHEIKEKKIGFFGFADTPNAVGFNKGNFYSAEYDNFTKSTVKKHQNDRYIAILAPINNAIFITSDNKIFKDAVTNGIFSIFIARNEKSFNKAIEYSKYVYNKSGLPKEDFKKILSNIIKSK